MTGQHHLKSPFLGVRSQDPKATFEGFDRVELSRGQESPARKLQTYLHDEWAGDTLVEDKWSTRSSLAFVLISCSLLWAGIWVVAQMIF